MGLFSFFTSNKQNSAKAQYQDKIPVQEFLDNQEALQPKQVLANNAAITQENKPNESPQQEKVVGLETIYNFLQADFESRGYNDALTNPDDSYKSDNLLLIKYDLQIIIHRVNTYHEDLLRELDFHILSRSRAGLIDLVEEMKNRKEMINEHVQKVMHIKNDMENEFGMVQRVLLSYQRGFMKGLSAISQSNVLNKQF